MPRPHPKVSIVTTSFNQARFLEQAIRSVVTQDYGNIEYIIVDAGSTDDSRAIIERHRHRFASVIFEPDDGPGPGLNKGFAAATGEIYGYLNSDDAFLPGALSRMARAFERHPDASVIYAHGYLVDEHGRKLRRLRSAPFGLRRCALGSAVIVQQATFVRREAFVAVGGFNPQNRTTWDAELLVDLALQAKRFARVDDYWGLFRLHRQSITGSNALADETRRDEERLFEKIMGRKHRSSDRLLALAARLEKWALDPRSFLIRAGELVLPAALAGPGD